MKRGREHVLRVVMPALSGLLVARGPIRGTAGQVDVAVT